MVAAPLAFALALDSAPAGAAPAETDTVPPRAVVRLREFVVRAPALHDPLSSETVHLVPSSAIRALPVDRLADLVALKAGVVARGEQLHVRGGRIGELVTQLHGLSLGEPLRGRAAEIPLIAVRDAELVSGGLDAEHGGGLAGVVNLRTVDPGERWEGELQWNTDGRRYTRYDRAAARLGGPLPFVGLGVVASVEALLDDTHLPALRTATRRDVLGGSFGWRADNRLGAHLKLATRGPAARVGLEVLATRRVDRPYDPMWTLDGWTVRCLDVGDCTLGPGFSPTPLPGFERYRAADHKNVTDDRRQVAILSWQRAAGRLRLSAALGGARARAVTSPNGRDDEAHLVKERAPEFGRFNSRHSDPFLVYAGEEPFFRRARSATLALRADGQRTDPQGNLVKVGAGVAYDEVEKRELDVSTFGLGVDSLRAFRAFAPGGFAYAQGRWVFEGLVANAGLRAEYFTAGPQAEEQTSGRPARGLWSLSPRLGVAYPISVRDVFSLSYARIQQNPGRDYLYENRRFITNRQPLGNPALEPATAVTWQAAVKHLFPPSWSVQAAVFYRDLWGLVGARNTRPRVEVPLMRHEGTDTAHGAGVELTVIRVADERSRVELSYTWLEARGTYSREEGVPFGPRLQRRPESIGDHPLDWDRRHTIALSGFRRLHHGLSLSWSTLVGSPLPWTPSELHDNAADLSRENTRRLDWQETSNAAARWTLPWALDRVTVGVEVRNVFDQRGDLAATADGYPNRFINALYDDYGAHRAATGAGGGGYWDDRDGAGTPGWVAVHDPRLGSPPRTIRMSLRAVW